MRRVINAQAELLDDQSEPTLIGTDLRPFPARPAIPAAFALAMGMWAGCAITLSSMMNTELVACAAFSATMALCAAALCAMWWRTRSHALAWLLVIGLVSGASLGAAKAAAQHKEQHGIDDVTGQLHIVALADGSSGSFGTSCLARVTNETGASIVAIASFPKAVSSVAYGDVFEGYGSVSLPSESREAYCWQKGAVANVKLRTCSKQERSDALGVLAAIRQCAVEALTNPQRIDEGLAAALVCGWRGNLPESCYQDFQVTGLAHVVAVSGAHLSIVVAFVGSLMRLLRLGRTASTTLQIGLILTYLVLTAVPVSAIRAAVMSIAGLLSWTAKRRSSSLSTLSVCIAGMIALDPLVALSASFALSATSTLGIVVFGSLFDRWIERLAPRFPAFAREALALSLASSVLATPISASLFSQLPLVAPLANVATGPLFGPICTAGIICAAGSVAFPAASGVLAAGACGLASLLRLTVHALACIPYASIPVTLPFGVALIAAGLSAAILWLWWPRPTSRRNRKGRLPASLAAAGAAVAIAIAIALVPPTKATEIIALDVGQGDAILLRSQGKSLLIDTGNQDSLLREALARQRIAHLDAVVITHPDDDHMGSLTSLRGVVQVDRVLVATDALTCTCNSCEALRANAAEIVGAQAVEGLSVADQISLGSHTLTCIWPKTFTDEGGNADSVCFLAETDLDANGQPEWKTLLVGDAEHDQIQALMDAGAVNKVDVYKVGHHGSKNALTDKQAQMLDPSVSLVSVGARNRYGHPAQNTIDALKAAGSEIFRTDESGDVVCRFTEEAIEVSCLR